VIRLNHGDKVDDLMRNNLRIIQNRKLPKFGLEGVLLANFPKVKDGWSICDLCTGTGIVPVLLTSRAKGLRITGIELVPELCDLAKRSVELNGLDETINILNEDIRTNSLEPHQFDLVTVNPPYFHPSKGPVSPHYSRAMARSQESISIMGAITSAFKLLKNKGKLAVVYRSSGLDEVLNSLEKLKMSVTRIRFVHHNRLTEASSFLLESQEGKNSRLVVEPPLLIKQTNGELSQEMNGLYFEGKALESRLN